MGPERYALRAPLVTRREGFRSAIAGDATRRKGETSPTLLHMPDSQLNRAERALQQRFMKSLVFNGLIMAAVVVSAYQLIRDLPDRQPMASINMPLAYNMVELPPAERPLRLVNAWILETRDPRFGGLSALSIDDGEFLALSDRGAVFRFARPDSARPMASISDLRKGPGSFGSYRTRDAESLVRDPFGRGWWIGYEQNHSLWLYDNAFERTLASLTLNRPWPLNSGAEGLTVMDGQLLVLSEDGEEAVRIENGRPAALKLHANARIADAARAPDGGIWVLLREIGPQGVRQSVAPLQKTHDGFRLGTSWPVPKGSFDNYEGLAIEAKPDGRWRFWLITDDDFRSISRTLLVALDLEMVVRHDKSPAPGTGPSKKLPVEAP